MISTALDSLRSVIDAFPDHNHLIFMHFASTKSTYQNIIFLIINQNMFWVLKRIVSIGQFF